MRKKKFIVPKENNSSKSVVEQLQEIKDTTDSQIQKGLAIPTASTGTPMNDLSGGAYFMAAVSNIGGGSKVTGGKGVAGGLETIMTNAKSKTALSTINNIENNKISNPHEKTPLIDQDLQKGLIE